MLQSRETLNNNYVPIENRHFFSQHYQILLIILMEFIRSQYCVATLKSHGA